MLGETLSHYRISREIGSGGMGVVYEAEDTVLGRRVAIKTIKRANEHKARLLREARAISQITHPNIATVYDYGETGEGVPFIVMELVEGEDLKQYLERRGDGLFEIVGIIIKVADALSAAHKLGIIHRDIKPSNIIIRENGDVKVLDFGLSRQLEADFDDAESAGEENLEVTRTQRGVILGTPLYLSPEQTLGEETDARSDVFSIGTLIYECVTGVVPFRAESVIEICAKILRDAPPAPSSINSSVPKTLDEITLKALAKKPEDRYKDAGEIADALREIHDDLPRDKHHSVAAFKPKSSQSIDTQKLRTGFSDVLRRRNVPALIFVVMLLLGLGTYAYWRTLQTSYQPTAEASVWYENGVRALNDGAIFAAKKNFEQAAETDKNFLMAKIRLAETLYELGYIEDANYARELANDLYANGESALSAQEEIRFQAINKTLLSEFDSAIEKYRQLTDYAGEAEKAQAFLDLSRAYERTENLPEAIANYEKVLTFNPNSAAAKLRLGVLYWRNQEFEKSEKSFVEAESLYKMQSNPEGEIEVNYQRGVYLSSKGNAEEAKDAVELSLKKAETIDISYQQVKCLLLLSRILRSSGKASEATTYAEKAESSARQNNINNLYAQSVLETGTTLLFQLKYDDAERKYDEALNLSRQYKVRVWENRTLLQLAALSEQKFQAEKTLNYINQCQSFFEKGNYKKDMLDLLSIKGRAITFQGKFDEALGIYRDLYKRADEIGDHFQKARSLKGVGTILAKQDKLSDALEPLYESYSLYNSINRTFEASYSLLTYTDVLLQLGRVGEFDKTFDQLEGLTQKYEQLAAEKNLLLAKAFLIKGNYDESIKIAEKLMAQQSSSHNFPPRIVAAAAYGKSGQNQKAKKIIEEAVSSANMNDDELTAAQAYLAQAEILMNDNAAKASESGSKAQTLLKKLGKPSLEWKAQILIGLAQKKLNNLESSREAFANANVIFSTLSQKWSAEDFKTYSEREDVKYFRQLL